MEAIRRLVGYVILNTDAVEIIVVLYGLLIVWRADKARSRTTYLGQDWSLEVLLGNGEKPRAELGEDKANLACLLGTPQRVGQRRSFFLKNHPSERRKGQFMREACQAELRTYTREPLGGIWV